MNSLLYLVVTSSLQNKNDVMRFAESVDISSDISVFFINQSVEENLDDVYLFEKCKVKEYNTYGIVPLSTARNIALKDMYSDSGVVDKDVYVMFVDDDAWFPVETLQMILKGGNSAMCLRTIDPNANKSFNGLSYTKGEVRGWHLIHDICSICLVVPYDFLKNTKQLFNEQLGVGNRISQGEESLFIYELHTAGLRIFYNPAYIYHPYKQSNTFKNYYSLSYFWAWGLTHVSTIFLWPCIKYLLKYIVGLALVFKKKRYINLFYNVWHGAIDGVRNKYEIVWERNSHNKAKI